MLVKGHGQIGSSGRLPRGSDHKNRVASRWRSVNKGVVLVMSPAPNTPRINIQGARCMKLRKIPMEGSWALNVSVRARYHALHYHESIYV